MKNTRLQTTQDERDDFAASNGDEWVAALLHDADLAAELERELGDYVRYRLGGPVMMIENMWRDNGDVFKVRCGWFGKDDAFHNADFPSDLLVLVSDDR